MHTLSNQHAPLLPSTNGMSLPEYTRIINNEIPQISRPTADCAHGDDDGFSIPTRQRKAAARREKREHEPKARPRPKAIYGTKTGTTLRSGPRRQEIFVFRVHREITDDELKTFIANENMAVKELECVSRDDSWTKSYRIVIECNDLGALLNPEFWPDGIGCRRYWRKRIEKTT